jgi:hypothetical protein
MNGWTRILDKNQYMKSHIFHDSLMNALFMDLRKKHPNVDSKCDLEFQTEDQVYYFDLPGMSLRNEPTVLFNLDNEQKIETRCHDVGELIMKIENAKLRDYAEHGSFYKIHGFLQCLVLTPEQRKNLLSQMRNSLDECDERAEAAWNPGATN